jgi:hypothetical protein
MSTTRKHTSIPGTAVEFAPGLRRTSLQRYDLPVPAGTIHAVRNTGTGTGTGTALATDIVEKGKPILTVAQ